MKFWLLMIVFLAMQPISFAGESKPRPKIVKGGCYVDDDTQNPFNFMEESFPMNQLRAFEYVGVENIEIIIRDHRTTHNTYALEIGISNPAWAHFPAAPQGKTTRILMRKLFDPSESGIYAIHCDLEIL